jgi:hypothetical protein
MSHRCSSVDPISQQENRCMHLLLMADAGNAEFLEIVSGEVAQCFSSNVILTECRFVAFQTQASQPTCDIHRRFLGSVTLESGVSSRLTYSVREQRIGRLVVRGSR